MSEKILIIDDMPAFRRLFRALLEPKMPGLVLEELEGVKDSTEIESIVDGKYDLILLDYQLRGHDGLSVQKELKLAGCTAPVILLTANSNEKLAVQAIKADVYDYIPKTRINQQVLLKSIRGAIKKKGANADTTPHFGINIRVKGYRPVRLLARGASSVVYLARRAGDGNQVVLKIVMVAGTDDRIIERFMREYELMESMEHENIGKIYQQAFTEEVIFMLMEYLEGGTLRERLSRVGSMSISKVLPLMVTLFEALHYIHEFGVLHRDIKPENILFRDANTPVIMDFGIASVIGHKDTSTAQGAVVGTPSYMSPEQAQGYELTRQSDVYSMGVVFYELLTGKKPFTGLSSGQTIYKIIHNKPKELPEKYVRLQGIMDNLLTKGLADRYKNAKEVVDALKQLMKEYEQELLLSNSSVDECQDIAT